MLANLRAFTRRCALWPLLAVVGPLLVGCQGATAGPNRDVQADPATPITVCYSGVSGAHGVAWYAADKGVFKRYGLDVKLVAIASGSKAAAALIAGDVDFCQMAGTAVVNAVAAGEDVVMIGGLFNVYLYSLVVAPQIKTAEDLRHQTLAVNVGGDATEMGTQVAVTTLGLRPDLDVRLLPIGEETARLAAMDAGRAVGTILVIPGLRVAEARGYHELLSMTGPQFAYPRVGIATTRKKLQANRPVALQFMRAVSETVAGMRQDPAGVKAVLARYLGLDETKDAALLDEAYTELYQKYIATVPYPTVAGMQGVIDFSRATDPRLAALRGEDMVDSSIVAELEASGLYSQLYK